ncbi:MAG: HAD family phosphatase [Lachnospiraceae bacterium]|nr:HAD family phosphatase [Lachnospiraceae bacterium]
MNSKCIFFDVDGTILDIEKGVAKDVPSAIQNLHHQGHMTFLCTGRSRAFIPKELEELHFTGMITNFGAYIEYGGCPVYQTEIRPKEARKIMEFLRERHMVPVMEGVSHIYYDLDEYTTKNDWYVDLMTEQLGEKWRPITGNEDQLHICKISAKRLYNSSPDFICWSLGHIFDAIRHYEDIAEKSIEFVMAGHSKGNAITVVCQSLEIPQEDTIAIADNRADISMFESVHTKIAMGDAPDELKEAADYVTETMDNGGITQALKHYGLIKERKRRFRKRQ